MSSQLAAPAVRAGSAASAATSALASNKARPVIFGLPPYRRRSRWRPTLAESRCPPSPTPRSRRLWRQCHAPAFRPPTALQAGGRRLSFTGTWGGMNEARGVAVRDRSAAVRALGRRGPGADLSPQRHLRHHAMVVRAPGHGAADRRLLLRALGQVSAHYLRASRVRRLHRVRLAVVALCQSLPHAAGR